MLAKSNAASLDRMQAQLEAQKQQVYKNGVTEQSERPAFQKPIFESHNPRIRSGWFQSARGQKPGAACPLHGRDRGVTTTAKGNNSTVRTHTL
jgi:hypothetical protein